MAWRGSEQRGTFVALAAASFAALAITIAYAFLLAPVRGSFFPDQLLYEQLGLILASTGSYGRSITDGGVVPEPLRTPGYPLFLAAVYKLAGFRYEAVAAAQAALAALLSLLVFAIARAASTTRLALVAAWSTALYLPIAYYAALTLTDFFATFLVTAGIAALLFARRSARPLPGIVAGALLGWAVLTRPVLAPVALVLLAWFAARALPSPGRRWSAIAAAAVFAFVLAPSLLYTYAHFGRLGTSASGPGVVLWLGYWQGTLSGRATIELNALVDGGASAELVERRAGELGLPAVKAADYAREARGLREIEDAAAAPQDRVRQYIDGDRKFFSLALGHIRDDLLGYLARGITYRSVAFWATEVPIAYNQIDALPRSVLLAIWSVQVALIGFALVGLLTLLRSRNELGLVLGLVAASLWAAYFPFHGEPRFALPAKPSVIILAVAGAAWLLSCAGRRIPRRWRLGAVG